MFLEEKESLKGKNKYLNEGVFTGYKGWNFKWKTPVKIAGNNQNLKHFLYSKPDFDGFGKILAVFDG